MAFREGLAITGMACVFPGAPTPDAFWARIVAATPAPKASLAARWGIPRELILGAVGEADRTYLDEAFAIPWDAFSPDDADPQVAVGRHVVREALASVAPLSSREREATALVVGTSWSAPSYFRDDALLASRGGALVAPIDHDGVYTPERQLELLARAGQLGGPRFAVDTACASSLYAVEAAARTIASGQAEAALVVGLNALLTPFLYVGFSKLRALSPEGRIVPFGVEASGIVPGEGAGAILLEPIERARASGRKILAVVRGAGLSSDGAERSVFAPGERGERLAYERAHAELDRGEVDYVEAHGTATHVGDETEIKTLQAFFGEARDRPLPIGSVKSLIGHTLASAGMASILKATLMLRAGVVPPHVRVTPHPQLASTKLALAFEPAPFAERGRPPRVGISAFGFGGSNAHLVIDGAPAAAPRAVAVPSTLAAGEAPRRLALVDAYVELGSAIGVAAAGAVARGVRALDRKTLATEHELDAAGLRMGPNLLRRLDPLQLLLAAAVRDRLAPLAANVSPERVGVVVVSNMGGDTSLRLARRDLFTHGGGGELHVETIASSLPSMASGYAAYHLDLRGFHETLAGGSGALFTALRNAPAWLESACDLLVLGAARILKSPLEWPHRVDGAGEGEGIGVLLVTTPERAHACNFPVRALLSVEASSEGATPLVVDERGDGELAAVFGRLGEASGLAALAAALSGDAPRASIDVRAPSPWRLVIERKEPFVDRARAAPRLPITVALARALPSEPKQEAGPKQEAIAPSPNAAALLAAIRASENAAHAVFATQREALALAAGSTSQNAEAPASSRMTPSVLRDVRLEAAQRTALVDVREDDPYFFDHPLDHVPGILLVAAVEELARAGAPHPVVTRMTLQFRRFCEKDADARIVLTRRGEQRFDGAIMQRGESIGSVEIALAPTATSLRGRGGAPSHLGSPPRVDAALVHKHRAENVLVSPLERDADGEYVCKMHVPASPHFLAPDGPHATALSLLEASRQVVMLGAHTVVGVPLGAPMNLLKIALELARRVPADAALEGRLVLGQKHDLGGMVLADVSVELRDARARAAEPFGVVRLKAQVVDAATYAAQRGKEPA